MIRKCLCSPRNAAEHAQRHIDENKRECLAKCLLEWSNRSNIPHNNEKQNLFLTEIKLRPVLPNKCYESKQGGRTSPKFHQTFAFILLGEIFDLFDRGFRLWRDLTTNSFQGMISDGSRGVLMLKGVLSPMNDMCKMNIEKKKMILELP